jgi:hypothetical protein
MLTIVPTSVVAADIEPEELNSLVKGRSGWSRSGETFRMREPPPTGISIPTAQCAFALRERSPMIPARITVSGRSTGRLYVGKLKRIGEQYGYKSACVRVRRVGERDYEMHNIKGFRQFAFRPVK